MFKYESENPITIEDIPKETTHLIIYPNYYHILDERCLPESVTKLTIERYYYDLPLLNIPKSITTLELIICGEIAINTIPPWINTLIIDCPHPKSKSIENFPQAMTTLVIKSYNPECKKLFKKIPFNCEVFCFDNRDRRVLL